MKTTRQIDRKTPRALSILLVGDANRPEFRDSGLNLERWGTVTPFARIDAAANWLAGGAPPPDVVIIAQAFPGQFSPQEIDGLRRAAPLAPVVGLLGSWCEGELRSGSPPVGVVRIYWHAWAARCDRELRRLASGAGGAWTLPPTATEEERLLAIEQHPPLRSGLVVIASQSPQIAQCLAAACTRVGLATLYQRPPITAKIKGTAAAIFDAGQLTDVELSRLSAFAAAMRPTPVISLLGFPRVEHRRQALSAGAAAVVSKPLLLDDLYWELEQVAG